MFDPYHRWLGIPRRKRPPTCYQLLGIDPDEIDKEVIAEAALRQTSHLRTYQTGPYAEQCTVLLNEIAQACTTLTHPERRRAYDAVLKREHFHSAPPNRTNPPTPASLVAHPRIEPHPLPRFPPTPVTRDTQGNSQAEPSAGESLFHPFALAYVGLLLFGGLLAFWLGRG